MDLNFTEEQKERIVQHYKENLEREYEECKKRMELLDIPGSSNLASKLQERLVQCCLDYIRETGNTEIDRVVFTADCLQESAKHGSWQACTDSTCQIEKSTDDGYQEISFSA